MKSSTSRRARVEMAAAWTILALSGVSGMYGLIGGGGGGSGGRRTMKNRPGGRGARGTGAVIDARSRRARLSISLNTSAAGRRRIASVFSLSSPPPLLGDDMSRF